MNALNTLPDDARALMQVIDDVDAYFLDGFVGGRFDVLARLAALFADTPLGARVGEAAAAIGRSAFSEGHFTALAAARTALNGALYDLLRTEALSALGRSPGEPDSRLPAPARADPLLESARHWLMEVAIAGFARLDAAAVTAFASTLAQIRAKPAAAAIGTLLTGLFHELLEATPVKNPASVPLSRWCDLWSRAMLGAAGYSSTPASVPVSGTFLPLGADVKQHARAACITLYGVLTADGPTRAAQVTWSTYKATAIRGDELFLLFGQAQAALKALADGKALTLADMPMLPSGNLLWDPARAEAGRKFKPFEAALDAYGPGAATMADPLPPLDRHPIQLAEPVAFSGYTVGRDALRLKDGTTLALDARRPGLAADRLGGTTALFGLLRFDEGAWRVQPLSAAGAQGKPVHACQSGLDVLNKPPKNNSVSILQERASRLLRKARA